MSKFLAIIPGKDFKVLDAETVTFVKRSVSINRQGIGYLNLETGDVVLQSNNQHDILDCIKNNGWAHTQRPAKIKVGSKVYIVPSNPVQSEYGAGAIGVSYVATSEATKVDESDLTWTSEK
jgi:hypothetical protein